MIVVSAVAAFIAASAFVFIAVLNVLAFTLAAVGNLSYRCVDNIFVVALLVETVFVSVGLCVVDAVVGS